MSAGRHLGYRAPMLRALTAIALSWVTLAGVSPQASQAAPAARRRPILDTHIHFYQVTRPGGVPWPTPDQTLLYRDVLPAEYTRLARAHGVVGAGIVEASPLLEDNFKVLDLVKGDRFYPFLVASIEVGTPDFVANLERLARDRRVVGVRAFLWNPPLGPDETQIAHAREIARRGMTLDIISRGKTNPKDRVSALAAAVPELRIIIDHLGGASGAQPTPEWELAMRRLADLHPNVHVKFSSFYDMYNHGGGEAQPWKAPTDLAAYQAHFDVLLSAFGEDRLIWGSNWPVCALGGDYGRQIEIAEEFLAPHGARVRDKVMYQNARKFYRRIPPRQSR